MSHASVPRWPRSMPPLSQERYIRRMDGTLIHLEDSVNSMAWRFIGVAVEVAAVFMSRGPAFVVESKRRSEGDEGDDEADSGEDPEEDPEGEGKGEAGEGGKWPARKPTGAAGAALALSALGSYICEYHTKLRGAMEKRRTGDFGGMPDVEAGRERLRALKAFETSWRDASVSGRHALEMSIGRGRTPAASAFEALAAHVAAARNVLRDARAQRSRKRSAQAVSAPVQQEASAEVNVEVNAAGRIKRAAAKRAELNFAFAREASPDADAGF